MSDFKETLAKSSVGRLKAEVELASEIAKVIWLAMPEDEKDDCINAAWRVMDLLQQKKLLGG